MRGPLAESTLNAFAPFTEQTLHHETQKKMYALMGSFAEEREISNQHELVTAFHDFVTSGKFETAGETLEGQLTTNARFAETVQPPAYKPSSKMLGVPSRGGRKVAL